MEDYAKALADAIDEALPIWVEQAVHRLLVARFGHADADLMAAAAEAGRQAQLDEGARVRALLEADIDEQMTTPLTIVREAVRYPTAVLQSAGVPPTDRDDFDRRTFPDDDYGLTPASYADLGPAVADAGLAWGAAKAFEHKARHQS